MISAKVDEFGRSLFSSLFFPFSILFSLIIRAYADSVTLQQFMEHINLNEQRFK